MSKSCACKFLYGAETSPEEKEKIEEALELQTELKTEVLFYRKNGKSVQLCNFTFFHSCGTNFVIRVTVFFVNIFMQSIGTTKYSVAEQLCHVGCVDDSKHDIGKNVW